MMILSYVIKYLLTGHVVESVILETAGIKSVFGTIATLQEVF